MYFLEFCLETVFFSNLVNRGSMQSTCWPTLVYFSI